MTKLIIFILSILFLFTIMNIDTKISCKESNNEVFDHFEDTLKPITGGKGSIQNVQDTNKQ